MASSHTEETFNEGYRGDQMTGFVKISVLAENGKVYSFSSKSAAILFCNGNKGNRKILRKNSKYLKS
jgi:hypothetical protein